MAPKKQPPKIEIISPSADQVFQLNAVPIETNPIRLQAKVFQDGSDVSSDFPVKWHFKLSWVAEYKTFQTILDVSGNSTSINFSTGGFLRIKATARIGNREISTRCQAHIIGTNPSRDQISGALGGELLLKPWHGMRVPGASLIQRVNLFGRW